MISEWPSPRNCVQIDVIHTHQPTLPHRLSFRRPRIVETFVLPQASLNFNDPTLKKLLKALPEAPAMARSKCLKMCGLDDPEEDKDSKDMD